MLDFSFTLNFTESGHVSTAKREKTPKHETANTKPAPRSAMKSAPAPTTAPKHVPVSHLPPPLAEGTAHLWRAKTRITFVSTHICPCCGKRTDFFSGHTIQFVARDIVAKHVTEKTHAIHLSAGDTSFSHLPLQLEYLTPQAVSCVACVADSLLVENIFAGRGPAQFPLFS